MDRQDIRTEESRIAKENCCCFTGHRNLTESDMHTAYDAVMSLIPRLVERGILRFYSGGAVGFDSIAAIAVLNSKVRFPELELILALPCRDHSKKWSTANSVMFEKISEKADCTVYVNEEYCPGCMDMRNKYMVDRSAVCVCWLTEGHGGTYKTVRYAEKKGLEMINLAPGGGSQLGFDF